MHNQNELYSEIPLSQWWAGGVIVWPVNISQSTLKLRLNF